MLLDDLLDDGEAEPGPAGFAASRGIDPIEALGKARKMLGCDPFALVTHDQGYLSIFGTKRDPGDTGLVAAAVADGVADQIVGQLKKLAEIAEDRRDIGFNRSLQLATAPFGEGRRMLERDSHDLGQIDLLVGGAITSASIRDKLIRSSTMRSMRRASDWMVAPNLLRIFSSTGPSSAKVSA